MRRSQLTLVATLAVALFLNTGAGTVAQGVDEDAVDPESVLFVGNSFTYFNGGVEKQVAGLAAAEDPPRQIGVVAATLPGATLKRHHFLSQPESTFGALDEIREGDHDAVVLQGDIPENYEQSVDVFLEYARLFDTEIKDAGARTVFFMTWPYERLDWIDLAGIVDAHRHVETELGASIAPVGLAMENALAERPDLAMLGGDREHPTQAGTYLAAATMYATLFDRSPEGLAFNPDQVALDDAAFLQRIAWATLQEWQADSAG